MLRNISFVIEGDVDTRITITENADGTLTFEVQVLDSGSIGDLRGLYFDLASDVGADGLSVVRDDGTVTDYDFDEASIDTLGQDSNIKGSVSNALGGFDAGVEFGTSGTAEDDIQYASFTLASTDGSELSLDDLDLQDFAIRYTSVGEAGGHRNDSLKLGDQSSGVAENDTLSVNENEIGNIDLLANDTIVGTNMVTAAFDGIGNFTATATGFAQTVVVNGLNLGTLTVGASGIAAFDANGADVDSLALGEALDYVFSYTTMADDGSSLATALVTLTIVGQNDAPDIFLAQGDSADAALDEIDAGLTASGTLHLTDPDLSDIVTTAVTGVATSGNDGDAATPDNATLLGFLSVPAAAVLEPTETGDSFTWNFNSGSEAFDYLAVGESLILTYTIRATDDNLATDTQNVEITIDGTNDAPVVSGPIDGGSTNEDATPVMINLLANASDPDTSDDLDTSSVAVVSSNGGRTVAFSIDDETGTLTIDPLQFNDLATSESETLTITYNVVDGNGGTTPTSATLVVEGRNDAPLVSTPVVGGITNEDAPPVTIDLLANASDPDSSDDLDTSAVSVASSNLARTVLFSIVDETGALKIDPAQFNDLALGESETLTVTYNVVDGNGGSTATTASLTVQGQNDNPDIFVNDGAGDGALVELLDGAAGLTASGTLSLSDADISDEVTLTVLSVIPMGDSATVLDNTTLKGFMTVPTGAVLAAGGTGAQFTYSFDSLVETFGFLDKDEVLTLDYTIEAMDSFGGKDSQIVRVTITGTNSAPDIFIGNGDIASFSRTEGDSGFDLQFSLGIEDLDITDSVTVAVTNFQAQGQLLGGPSFATLESYFSVPSTPVLAAGDIFDRFLYGFNTQGEAFDYLLPGQSLTLTYTITATDDQGEFDSQDVSITIDGTNDAPELIVLTKNANAPGDPDATVSFGNFSESQETDSSIRTFGIFRFQDPDLDKLLSEVGTSFNVASFSPNLAAYLAANFTDSNMILTNFFTVHGVQGSDGSDDAFLTWSFNSDFEAFDFLKAGEVATITYNVIVSDGTLLDGEQVEIRIIGTADAPVAMADSASTSEDTPVVIDVFANDFDPDGENINLVPIVLTPPVLNIITHEVITPSMQSGAFKALNGTVESSLGGLKYTPNAHFSGEDTIYYYLEDSDGSAVEGIVSVDVAAVADTPFLQVTAAPGASSTDIVVTITAVPRDTDGSETVDFEVFGIPEGIASTLIDFGGFSQLSFSLDDPNQSFDLSVVATATEISNGDTAQTTVVTPIEELPVIEGFAASLVATGQADLFGPDYTGPTHQFRLGFDDLGGNFNTSNFLFDLAGSFGLSAGLTSKFAFDGGSLSAALPFDVSFDTVLTADMLSITPVIGFDPVGAVLSILGPDLMYSILADIAVSVAANLDILGFDAADFSESYSNSGFQLFSYDSSGSEPLTFLDDLLVAPTFGYQAPMLSGLDLDELSDLITLSSRVSNAVTLNLDLDALIATVFFGGTNPFDFGIPTIEVFGAKIGATVELLDIDFFAGLDVAQSFTFDPGDLSLDLMVEDKLFENISLTETLNIPLADLVDQDGLGFDVSALIDVTGSSFSNDTDLIITLGASVESLEFALTGTFFGEGVSFSVGPLFDFDGSADLATFDVFTETIDVAFDTTTFEFLI